MSELSVGVIFRVPDPRIGETCVDELFDAETATEYALNHPIRLRCERFIGRDPGDNLIVIVDGAFCYWDHESDDIIRLGLAPSEFTVKD